MIFQYRDIWLVIISKFSISPVANTRPLALIPDKSIFIICDYPGSFCIIVTPTAPITGDPILFQVICGICAHAPVMSVSTNLTVYIKIIKQYKIICQLVLVRCYLFTE